MAYRGHAAESNGRSAGFNSATKRPRSEFDLLTPGSRDVPAYYLRSNDARVDVRSGRGLLRETDPLGPAYDRYIQSGIPPYGSSGLSSVGDLGGLGSTGFRRIVGTGLSRSVVDDSGLASRRLGIEGINPGLGGIHLYRDPLKKPEDYLPADASNTLFVEGLPAGCERREVAHIFRPFVGFKEVRIVKKEPKHPQGDSILLCFVDFNDARCAAAALEGVQGYKFDENDRDSRSLKLQFARPLDRKGGSSAARNGGDYASRRRF